MTLFGILDVVLAALGALALLAVLGLLLWRIPARARPRPSSRPRDAAELAQRYKKEMEQ